jgi:hypothetical protein
MLLVRPRPAVGESPMSFLFRVALANGYMSVSQLLGLVRRDGAEPWTLLFEQLGLPMHAQHLLCGMAPGRWSFERQHLGLEASDFNWARKRWCSACLQERPGVFLGAWSQKLACCCLAHACWLSDRCAACGKIQHWSDPSLDSCRCGARLSEAVIHGASPADLMLAGALIGYTLWPSGKEACFAHLSMRELSRLVRLIGRFGDEIRPKKVGKTPNLDDLVVSKELLTSASHLLSHWPTDFHALLQRTQEDRSRDPSLNRTFQPIYRVLYALLPGVEYQFIRDAFEDYLHEHWWGLVCRRNRRLKVVTVMSHPRRTIAQSAAATDATSTTVKRLVQSARVTGSVSNLPSGRATTSVLFSELADLADEVRGCLTLAEAASSLQLGERRIRHLIEQGVLRTLTGERSRQGFARWLIPRQSLASLFFCPNASLDVQSGIFVHQAFKYWRLSDVEGVALVRALQGGTLTAVGSATARAPLGMVVLNRLAALDWLSQHRASRVAHLSVPQAATALGLKQQVVYELVARKLLPTECGKHGERLVTMEALADFTSTYVSLGALSKRLDTSPRALLRKLTVLPVCGPTVDGARQYFYRRQDVGNLFDEVAGGLT